MNNAEKFQEVFGYYATEMWAKPEREFLEWINSEYVPTIEVSEDCISREDTIDKLKSHKAFFMQAWNNDFSIMDKADKSRVDELDHCISVIVNAPSVLPTAYNLSAVEDCISRKWIAEQTEPNSNANQCVQRVEYVGDIEKKRCRTCRHFKSEFQTPISSDGTYYTYVICTAKECHYESVDTPQTNCGARMKG